MFGPHLSFVRGFLMNLSTFEAFAASHSGHGTPTTEDMLAVVKAFTRDDWNSNPKWLKAQESAQNVTMRVNNWIRDNHDAEREDTFKLRANVIWWNAEDMAERNHGIVNAKLPPDVQTGYMVLWLGGQVTIEKEETDSSGNDDSSGTRTMVETIEHESLSKVLTTDFKFKSEELFEVQCLVQSSLLSRFRPSATREEIKWVDRGSVVNRAEDAEELAKFKEALRKAYNLD